MTTRVYKINGIRVDGETWAAYATAALPTWLADAWDDGFTARAREGFKQRDNPDHPITRTNPYSATEPSQ